MEAKPQRRIRRGVAIAALVVVAIDIIPSPKTSVTGRIVRWILGESAVEQGVNDVADAIEDQELEDDLVQFADNLVAEFGPKMASLPKQWADGRDLPINRLPLKFRELGGYYGFVQPELMYLDQRADPRIVVSWAHMRHAVVVYSSPRHSAPSYRHVRKVSERVYVTAF